MAENGAQIAFAKRTHFYVGGQNEKVTQPIFGESTVLVGQIYVESLEPLQVRQKWPIVMIPGGGQTGSSFLNTPDGRPGWACYFLNRGYHLYIIDQPARGRSATLPTCDALRPTATASQEFCTRYWTAAAKFNLWDQAKHHTQWPGAGMPGDSIFDAFYASQVPFVTDFNYAEGLMQSNGLALLERIGPAIILTHSQSGMYAYGIADVAQPKGLVKGVVSIEPMGPPFVNSLTGVDIKDMPRPLLSHSGCFGMHTAIYLLIVPVVYSTLLIRLSGLTSIPLTYKPPIASASDLKTVALAPSANNDWPQSTCLQQDPKQPGGPRQLPHLQGFPFLIVTGQASYHTSWEHGTVQYLRDAGADVTWFQLGEMGILGNGHFMFMEKNSDEIAESIASWLESILGI